MWSQWHRIPAAALSREGLLGLAAGLGRPISDVVEVFAGGNKFYKIKILAPIDQALQDRKEVLHPILGNIKIYLSYERLERICLFCAKVGHDHHSCADRCRMERLCMDPRFASRPDVKELSKLKVGLWINNQAKIPLTNQNQGPQNFQPNSNHPDPNSTQNLHPNPNPHQQNSPRPSNPIGQQFGMFSNQGPNNQTHTFPMSFQNPNDLFTNLPSGPAPT